MTELWKQRFQNWVEIAPEKRSTGDIKDEQYFQSVATNVARFLQLEKNDFLLDIGADSGLVTRYVAKRVSRVVAVDFVYGQVRDFKNDRNPGNADFVVADATQIPFFSNTFEKVCLYNILHVIPTKELGLDAIKNCIRVCKLGGFVLVGDFADADKRRFMWQSIYSSSSKLRKWRLLIGRLLPRWLKRLMKGGGYQAAGDAFVWHSGRELKEFFEMKGYQVELKNQLKNLSGSMYRSNLIIRKSGG